MERAGYSGCVVVLKASFAAEGMAFLNAISESTLDTHPTVRSPDTAWWEIHIAISPAQEDSVFWRLQSFGCQGTVSESNGQGIEVRAYLSVDTVTPLDLSALALLLRQDALLFGTETPAVHWERIEATDWSTEWKQHWQPQEIGDKILICPAWLKAEPANNRHVLIMDPGAAFGTGAHPTTQMCAEALEMHLDFLEPDERVEIADIGCGSGILSLVAAKLGAERVYAVDTDELAVEATTFNIRQNDVEDRVEIYRGSLDAVPRRVDGLVCNILAEVIIDLIPQFELVLRPDGWLVLSGVLVEQAKTVSATLEAHGWTVAALWKRKEWCCLNIRRV